MSDLDGRGGCTLGPDAAAQEVATRHALNRNRGPHDTRKRTLAESSTPHRLSSNHACSQPQERASAA